SAPPARLCAHELVSVVDVVRVELADNERRELGMLDAHDLSRCRVQRSFEASREEMGDDLAGH
ncbi:MAG: hypothetical protein ACLPN6_17755, partial [Streptosporangiaceae bacterium]